MLRTEENITAIDDMVSDFDVLKYKPTDAAICTKLKTMLANAYIDACRDMETAETIHQAVMRHEDEYPRPATLRKYLRQLNFVECDADMESGV